MCCGVLTVRVQTTSAFTPPRTEYIWHVGAQSTTTHSWQAVDFVQRPFNGRVIWSAFVYPPRRLLRVGLYQVYILIIIWSEAAVKIYPVENRMTCRIIEVIAARSLSIIISVSVQQNALFLLPPVRVLIYLTSAMDC